jgi:DNA-binding NarL/FixJ family response regulator
MQQDNGATLVGAVVAGPSGLSRDTVTAVLNAAGIELVTPGDGNVVVVVDPLEDDWASLSSLGAKVVLVTSTQLSADEVPTAVMRGADAVVEIDASSERLAHAVRTVAVGGTELSPSLVRRVADALRVHAQEGEEKAITLTPRERQILASIDAGQTVKQTARSLGIAPKTVENLQSRMFKKLGVRNRAQAIALAHSLGLVPPENGQTGT